MKNKFFIFSSILITLLFLFSCSKKITAEQTTLAKIKKIEQNIHQLELELATVKGSQTTFEKVKSFVYDRPEVNKLQAEIKKEKEHKKELEEILKAIRENKQK